MVNEIWLILVDKTLHLFQESEHRIYVTHSALNLDVLMVVVVVMVVVVLVVVVRAAVVLIVHLADT
jgi:hypothetical protein